MKKMCHCPYIVCPYRNNCTACIAHNIEDGTLPNCMEEIGQNLGAKINLRVPDTEVVTDGQAVAKRCAQLVKECLDEKSEALLCIHAGSTVVETGKALKEMQDKGEVDFSKTQFVALDEWLDLEDGSESRASFLQKHLFGPLGIKSENIYLFNVKAEDLESECKRMDQIISDCGGIDLMLLGMGLNGRLGFNEPEEDFVDYTKVVELTDETIEECQKYFSKPTKLTRGITLGVHNMFEAKKVILQISGEAKKDITEKMYYSQPMYKIPGTVIVLLSGAKVVLDEDAAAGIKELL